MSTTNKIDDILDKDDIQYILDLPRTLDARMALNNSASGSRNFKLNLPTNIKNKLTAAFGITLTKPEIPCRWIKGDLAAHHDVSTTDFDNTYLVYLTSSPGNLVIGESSYHITQGTGFMFNEGLIHSTTGTGNEPRLLIGPMNELGNPVGAPSTTINQPGGTTVYIKQIEGDIKMSLDLELPFSDWDLVSFPCYVENTSIADGYLKIIFKSNIILTTDYAYFIVYNNGGDTISGTTGYIQFGNTSLESDGSRIKITIDGTGYEGLEYPGLIRNGDSENTGFAYVNVFNLEVEPISGAYLLAGSGWICQQFFGKYSNDNNVVNCKSSGNIGNSGGGILGANSGIGGRLYVTGCSSSGDIEENGGGIMGAGCGHGSGFIRIEKCWSIGVIGANGGGITGYNTGFDSGMIEIISCYSEGNINQYAGGITGQDTCINGDYINIINCYSKGTISAEAGGIIGKGLSTGTIRVINCYTVGNIDSGGLGGGICGPLTGEVSAQIFIDNCYVAGATNTGVGFIISDMSIINGVIVTDSIILTGNFAEALNETSGWNRSNALATLTGTPAPVVGASWVEFVADAPFLIWNMGYSGFNTQVVEVVDNTLSFAGNYPFYAVGGYPRKDMTVDEYTFEFTPANKQETLFVDLAPFTDENILQGDKTEETRFIASYWDDLGNDIFDDWGFFYIYDVASQKYYFPILTPINQVDGLITAQTFEAFGRTFTIKHGWQARGIFKLDITMDDDLEFRFGAYGNMGSDGDQNSNALTAAYTVNGASKTLYYNRDAEENNDTEILYSYFVPKTDAENVTKPYVLNYDSDDMSMYTNPLTSGVTIYYSKTIDVKDWVINQIKLTTGDPEINKLARGESTTAAVVLDRNYTILQINDSLPSIYNTITINNSTGIISTTANTPPGLYNLYIYSTGSYNFTQVDIYIEGQIHCFTPGTLVLTPIGYACVEKLLAGQLVLTESGRKVPIINIHKSVVPVNPTTLPVTVLKGSLGKNIPSSDFTISQNHLIHIGNGNWILPKRHFSLAKQFANKSTITYYHIELPNYCTDNLIINNGICAESYCLSASNPIYYAERYRRMHNSDNTVNSKIICKRIKQIKTQRQYAN